MLTCVFFSGGSANEEIARFTSVASIEKGLKKVKPFSPTFSTPAKGFMNLS